ncbi:MAG: DUF1835 domain-containing protein [bacterium]|nr:DUF1835 domain-containing protein [bacterium]
MKNILHIHCGDCSADTLKKSTLKDDIIVWCDILSDGPTPSGLSTQKWLDIRSKHISKTTEQKLPVKKVRGWLSKQDKSLENFRNYKEVVLWFDACLFDQTILIRQLDWFSKQNMGKTKLSLICIDEFPGFKKFIGLGELNPKQMASLFKTRHPVTKKECALAQKAWSAFCSPTPMTIQQLIKKNTSALPFLHDALIRHSEQFPSLKNGLNRLENTALEAVAKGKNKLIDIFIYASLKEERPFWGDTTLWECLHKLSKAKHPLLKVKGGNLPLWNPPKDLSKWEVYITDTGKEILSGKKDFIKINGIDKWLGGTHINKNNIYRWNEKNKTLTAESQSSQRINK